MSEESRLRTELQGIEAAITVNERLGGMLQQDELAAILALLRQKRSALEARLQGSGAMAQGVGSASAGGGGVAITGDMDNSIVVLAENGAQVVVRERPSRIDTVDRDSALGCYLDHVIRHNCYLQLQGIRSGDRLVNIELDRIYVRLRTTRQRLAETQDHWLAEEAYWAPGEARRLHGQEQWSTETVTIGVEEALAGHGRLLVLGDPGCGKTTLLRYLALVYAKDLAEDTRAVQKRLGNSERARLPILLPLRRVGRFLQKTPDDGTEGHKRLLDFLLRLLKDECIELPGGFFEEWLKDGRAVLLLDGLDEVADPGIRRRVSRLVEHFTQAYSDCRYVVTSRIRGYTDAVGLGESYVPTTVREFTLEDIQQFLGNWHRLVAVGQMGPGKSAESYAAEQTRQLMQAIQGNPRIRDLAINPLMLTVIAIVHRDRVKLPDRRAELYGEAVDVLLGKWDEAREVQELPVLPGQSFDTGDKRLMLQSVALRMHEQARKEIELSDLRQFLEERFGTLLPDARQVGQAVHRFLDVIEQRTGLLVGRGEGVYAFSHLTFQEYLAALAVAARDDYIHFTRERVADPWWREVILLEAGFLSTQGKERTTRLIRAIADRRQEPEPYHNLELAAECLRDVGANRVERILERQVQQRLRTGLEAPPPLVTRWFRKVGVRGWVERRGRAMEALARVHGGLWSPPHGEPEWVDIPEGSFWMGSEMARPQPQRRHRLELPAYQISKAPVTNAQYHLFTEARGHRRPRHWEGDRPPKGLESHPVVYVSWHDALAYCTWLSEVTEKPVTLPSEAKWEKAARGNKDHREYPWGDRFEAERCNSGELGLGTTTAIGIFPEGASPYGCLDMAGNVWEWTRSLWGKDREKPDFRYPYDPKDGREDLSAADEVPRVLRGGSFLVYAEGVRCACRDRSAPVGQSGVVGFRVVLSPFFSGL